MIYTAWSFFFDDTKSPKRQFTQIAHFKSNDPITGPHVGSSVNGIIRMHCQCFHWRVLHNFTCVYPFVDVNGYGRGGYVRVFEYRRGQGALNHAPMASFLPEEWRLEIVKYGSIGPSTSNQYRYALTDADVWQHPSGKRVLKPESANTTGLVNIKHWRNVRRLEWGVQEVLPHLNARGGGGYLFADFVKERNYSVWKMKVHGDVANRKTSHGKAGRALCDDLIWYAGLYMDDVREHIIYGGNPTHSWRRQAMHENMGTWLNKARALCQWFHNPAQINIPHLTWPARNVDPFHETAAEAALQLVAQCKVYQQKLMELRYRSNPEAQSWEYENLWIEMQKLVHLAALTSLCRYNGYPHPRQNQGIQCQ